MKSSWIASGVLGFTMVVGCGVNPPIQPRMDPYGSSQIHMTSEELRTDTAVSQPVVAYNESGLMTVTVPIRSAIDKTLYVDYYVTFFDASHMPIGKTGPKTITLQPNTPDQINVTAMDKRAKDFQIDFRYAK